MKHRRIGIAVLWVLVMAACVFGQSLERPLEGRWALATTTGYATGCTKPFGVNDPREHAEPQKTASGKEPEPNWHMAADAAYYPFGTVVMFSYQGVLSTRVVEDRGGAIKGRGRFDLVFEDCERAAEWGVRRIYYRVHRMPLGGQDDKTENPVL